MSPKEKATKLIDDFKEYSDEDYMDTKSQFELNETRAANAKKCAEITVNEIINALNDNIYIQGETDLDSHLLYWNEVKNEILMS